MKAKTSDAFWLALVLSFMPFIPVLMGTINSVFTWVVIGLNIIVQFGLYLVKCSLYKEQYKNEKEYYKNIGKLELLKEQLEKTFAEINKELESTLIKKSTSKKTKK